MIEQLITDHLDLWSSAVRAKSSAGRGSNSKLELTGIKKLRELILELAVRGKLVPQDPSDEPASVLLERIKAEKARLVKEGKIKKSKPLPEITDEEKPFELPEGWEWCRLGHVGVCSTGKTPSTSVKEYFSGDIPFIGPGQITQSGDIMDSDKFLSESGLLNSEEANQGDIFTVCIGGSIGKSAIVYGRVGFNQQINAIKPINFASTFLYSILSTRFFIDSMISASTGSATPIINRSKWESLLIPCASINEQHRIVAKVDELMSLCDQLEQKSETSLAAHQTLVETLLATLTDSADSRELAQNWERLAQHFDSLFTTQSSIDALKQTILQLAVMGKLVRQDHNDEPASVLLQRIAAEKARLIKEGNIKKEKPLPPISEEEKPFPLPDGWEWCRLNELTLSSEAGWSPQCDAFPRENNNWGVLKVSAVTWGKFNPLENKALPLSLDPRPEFEIKAGDFLISRANTADLVARAVVVPENSPTHLMMSDKIIRFVFSDLVSADFVNLVNNCQLSRNYYSMVAGGTSSSMKNVSRGQIQNLLIPLPPYEEELKINNKVDDLMSLCDQLSARLQASQTTQLQLAEALVEGALN